ncbi:hypothetical protein COLO4_25768 [Corchorus olitorius]|uniref:Uncharacterized protein n=1 Tax=Corchorus olitorius TaxID=93759 RepID=A0A1R3I065_9ROSI|nr:hypothetical protein COLO4_25768 [Corchorus olitorius]
MHLQVAHVSHGTCRRQKFELLKQWDEEGDKQEGEEAAKLLAPHKIQEEQLQG